MYSDECTVGIILNILSKQVEKRMTTPFSVMVFNDEQ